MSEEMAESQEAVENVQAELHEKGALLSKVWSDLFSLFTKYQADLFVRENSINVAEKQMEFQKAQIKEMKAEFAEGQGNSSDELSKLQEELNAKELAISKLRVEFTTTDNLLHRVQNDLASHRGLLDKTQTEMMEKQNRLVRVQMDNEKFKMELSVKDEQISVKDRLLRKIQDEMRRENEEFKERVRQLEEVLDSERRAHAATRRRLQSKAASGSQVIEIPDSPPLTLDMSVEHQDFAISSIMSLAADSQRKDSYTASSQQKNASRSLNSPSFQQQSMSHSPQRKVPRTSTMTLQNRSLQNDSVQSESWKLPSPSLDPNIPTSSNSDNFQLNQIDTSQMKLISDVEMEHSDSNRSQDSSPVPVSGPIPSGSLHDKPPPPGMSGEVKEEASAEFAYYQPGQVHQTSSMLAWQTDRLTFKCPHCPKDFKYHTSLFRHMKNHSQPRHICPHCRKGFHRVDNLRDHVAGVHTGVRRYQCHLCDNSFHRNAALMKHLALHQHNGGQIVARCAVD